MEINELTGVIVNLCIKIHTRINPGYFERVYEEMLYYELQQLNIVVQRQLMLPIHYDKLTIENA